MSRPTIRDVAARAGVSISVASNALNHKGRVSAETRRKVRLAARAINYVPSYAARRMRGSGRAVGVLVTTPFEELIATRYYHESLYAMVQTADRLDYKLHYLHIPRQEFTPAKFEQRLHDGAIDGLVLLAPTEDEVAVLGEFLFRSHLPFVLFGASPEDSRFSYVDSDGYDGAMQATRHLLQLGHTRIAYLMLGKGNYNARSRKRGYIAAMENAGLPPHVYLVPTLNAALPTDEILADEMTAVVAFDDFYAVRLISDLERRGHHVPQDMAVIGFDDEKFGQWLYPRLTTLRQPLLEMGQMAISYLQQCFEQSTPPNFRQTMPMTLVVRESCGAAA